MESQSRQLNLVSSAEARRASQPRILSAPVLRVLIDARKLGHGGIGVYIDNLISGILSVNARRRLLEDPPRTFPLPEVELGVVCSTAEARQYPWFNEVEIFDDPARLYSLDELFYMPRRLPLQRFNLFHSPHYTLPFRLSIPSVVTVHDLIHVYHPERWYYPALATPLIRSSLKRAQRIIAVSHATLRDLSRLAGARSEIHDRLRLIPNAVDPFYAAAPDHPHRIRSEFNIPGPYLLAVISTMKPHKGLADLLAAWERVVVTGANVADDANVTSLHGFGSEMQLLLVGQGMADLVELPEFVSKSRSLRALRCIGALSKRDMRALYQHASALVVPSRSEGFCLPALEAHACGTRVLSRPVPALFELLDGDDVVCDDFSIESLTLGLKRVIREYFAHGASQRAQRSLIAQRTFQNFGREDIARSVLQVYVEAAQV